MIDAVGMKKFKLGEGDLGAFELLLENVKPDDRGASYGKAKRDFNNGEVASGIYLWVMSWNGFRYGIYIGKSVSIVGRLSNYSGEFQPHTPNNFKIRYFYDFMTQNFPGATLDLYYQLHPLLDKKELHVPEKAWIDQLNPLINQLNKIPSLKNARLEIKEKFRAFYETSFTEIIRVKGSE